MKRGLKELNLKPSMPQIGVQDRSPMKRGLKDGAANSLEAGYEKCRTDPR